MISKNFTLTQGDSLEFTITIEDTEIAPDDIVFSVVDNINSEEPVIVKSLTEGGIEREGDEDYIYRVYIPYTDTDDLKILNYYYQISLLFGSVHETVAEGKFVITPEI